MNIETQTGVPIGIVRSGQPAKYPFRTMSIGASFFVPRPQLSTSHWTQRTGKRFVTRKVVEAGVAGRRCWRINDDGTIPAGIGIE